MSNSWKTTIHTHQCKPLSFPPSLPPLFFSHSKPKPKKQATVDYSPPPVCCSKKRNWPSLPDPHSNPQHHKNRSELRAREPRQEQLACSLARSLLRNSTHETRTHARTETRTETNARDGNWESRSSRVRVTGFCRLAFWANVTVEMRAEFCCGQGQGQGARVPVSTAGRMRSVMGSDGRLR